MADDSFESSSQYPGATPTPPPTRDPGRNANGDAGMTTSGRTAGPATAEPENRLVGTWKKIRAFFHPQATGQARDGSNFREIAETVVFVVVLVLLLKTFVAEAFVIPTG